MHETVDSESDVEQGLRTRQLAVRRTIRPPPSRDRYEEPGIMLLRLLVTNAISRFALQGLDSSSEMSSLSDDDESAEGEANQETKTLSVHESAKLEGQLLAEGERLRLEALRTLSASAHPAFPQQSSRFPP